MVVHHRPADQEKECRGSCRANYIKLLKLGVKEDPADSRRSYYYGRELYFDEQWEKVRRGGRTPQPPRAAGSPRVLCWRCPTPGGSAAQAESCVLGCSARRAPPL